MDRPLMYRAGAALIVSAGLLLGGCEGVATPVAALLPATSTPDIQPTLPPPLRYALADNTAGFITDMGPLNAAALIDQLTDDGRAAVALASYDVVAGFGLYEGWAQSPVQPVIGMILNPALRPLDDAALRDLVQQAIRPDEIVSAMPFDGAQALTDGGPSATQTRQAFASIGQPDGLRLTLIAAPVPGLDAFIGQFEQANIFLEVIQAPVDEIETRLNAQQAHIALLMMPDEAAMAALAQSLGMAYRPLIGIPISYSASPDLLISFDDASGFPIPARPTPAS